MVPPSQQASGSLENIGEANYSPECTPLGWTSRPDKLITTIGKPHDGKDGQTDAHGGRHVGLFKSLSQALGAPETLHCVR
jgi:hypothetical protein